MQVKDGLFLISGELTDRLETQAVVRQRGTFDIAAVCLSTERVGFIKTRVEPPSLINYFFYFFFFCADCWALSRKPGNVLDMNFQDSWKVAANLGKSEHMKAEAAVCVDLPSFACAVLPRNAPSCLCFNTRGQGKVNLGGKTIRLNRVCLSLLLSCSEATCLIKSNVYLWMQIILQRLRLHPLPRNVVLIQIRLGPETRQEAVTAKPQFALIWWWPVLFYFSPQQANEMLFQF